MDSTSFQSIQDILAKNETLGIAVGKNPTLDEMGAALALYLSLKSTGKQITIATPSDPLVEISTLVGINKVKKSLDGEGGDLIVSFPYQEGEIEKVSYTLEEGFLNIIVKAAENGLSFSEKDVQFKNSGGLPQALFVVGTARLSDLGILFDPTLLKDTTLINIDNKSDNQGFGDVVLVSSEFSSVSEQVASLIDSLSLPIDIDIAQNLLLGISFATDNFQSTKTSMLAFEMTAKLMQKGARRVEVQKKQSFDPAQGNQGRQFPRQSKPQSFGGAADKPFGLQQNRGQAQNPFMQQPRVQAAQPVQNRVSNQQQTQPFNSVPVQQVQGVQGKPFGDAAGKQQRPQTQQVQSQPFGSTAGRGFQNQPFNQTQGRPVQTNEPEVEKQNEVKDEKDAPPDWLTPKVYKGSTLV